MTSQAKITANRQNALKSTGPRTEVGKRSSSQNAVTHGLTAKYFVAQGEEEEQFEAIARSTLGEFPPRSVMEEELVKRVIELQCKISRARLFEMTALGLTYDLEVDKARGIPQSLKKLLPTYKVLELSPHLDDQIRRWLKEMLKIAERLSADRLPPVEPLTIEGECEQEIDGSPDVKETP